MKSFVPYLFIGIGANANFYTLRETYLHHVPAPHWLGNAVINGEYQGTTEVRSFHHFNLSQNAEEALEKAREHSQHMAIELRADLSAMKDELAAIHRATAEQMQQRRESEALWEAERLQMREEAKAEQETMIRNGIFPFGPYRDKPFTEARRDYITWIARTLPEFEEGSMMRLLAETIVAKFAHLILPSPKAGVTIGEQGQRLPFKATVVRAASFDSDFGTLHILTMVAENGACLVSKSTSFNADIGEELQFKATVKGHAEYRGQIQTQIQRIALNK
jgi:hypothetical protein